MVDINKIKTYFKDADHKILLLAFCIYLPFIFLGYGSDYDSYNVIWAGENFVETLDYVPSRVPGFFIYEFITFFFNFVGGFYLTNFASMGMSLLILSHFMRFCRENQVPHYRLLTLILMVQPYYLVNSTCTMDYLFAFGFAFLGLMKFRDRKFFAAGVLMALGIGSRLTTGLVVAVFYLWEFITKKEDRWKIILSGVITALLTVLFYVPSMDFAEWNFAYVSPSVGTNVFWTPILRIGRFVYKTIYFWSPLVIAMLVWGIIRLIVKRSKWTQLADKSVLYAGVGLILVIQSFYMYIPTEPAYMIPTIPFWLILMGVAFSDKKNVLKVLLVLVVLSNFVSINVARPDKVNQATGAQYGLWVEPGHLVKDVQKRIEYINCGYQPCSLLETPGETLAE
jgi:hypothetical protein